MKKAGIALLAMMVLAVPSSARAAPQFSYVLDSSTYAVGSDTVSVYLQEFVPTGSTSLSQNLNITGTNIIGVYLSTTGTATITGFTPNAAFNTSVTTDYSLGGSAYDYSGAQPTTPPATGQKLGNGTAVAGGTNYSLLVATATVNFTPGSSLTVTTFAAAPAEDSWTSSGADPGGADSTYTTPAGTNKSYDLDAGGTQTGSAGSQTFGGANGQTFTATASAVPEPSSMLLCGLAALGGAYSSYRKRKAKRLLEAATFEGAVAAV